MYGGKSQVMVGCGRWIEGVVPMEERVHAHSMYFLETQGMQLNTVATLCHNDLIHTLDALEVVSNPLLILTLSSKMHQTRSKKVWVMRIVINFSSSS